MTLGKIGRFSRNLATKSRRQTLNRSTQKRKLSTADVKARESMRPASETATPSPVMVILCDLDSKSHTGQESDPRRKSLTKQTICLKNLLQGRKQKERLTDSEGRRRKNQQKRIIRTIYQSGAHANDDAMAARSERRDGQTYCADAKLNLTQLRIHFVSRRSELRTSDSEVTVRKHRSGDFNVLRNREERKGIGEIGLSLNFARS